MTPRGQKARLFTDPEPFQNSKILDTRISRNTWTHQKEKRNRPSNDRMMGLVDKDLKTGTANKFKDLQENMKTGKKEMEDFFTC